MQSELPSSQKTIFFKTDYIGRWLPWISGPIEMSGEERAGCVGGLGGKLGYFGSNTVVENGLWQQRA